jgi:hypothetical protein
MIVLFSLGYSRRNIIAMQEMLLSRERTKMTTIDTDNLPDFFAIDGESIRIQDPQFRMAFSHPNSFYVAKSSARSDNEI